MDKESLETLNVSIGGESVTYAIAETLAPKAYDGFGTLTLLSYDNCDDRKTTTRIVLIREDQLTWQVGRYNSGLHYATKPTGFDASAVSAHLWEKLQSC